MAGKDSEGALEKLSGIEAAAESAAFLDWLWDMSLKDAKGQCYWFNGSLLALKLENIDLAYWEICRESGAVQQEADPFYKIADFDGGSRSVKDKITSGVHKINCSENELVIEINGIKIVCCNDHSWDITINAPEKGLAANLYFQPACSGPFRRRRRQKPSYLTQHSAAYGYNCSGSAKGILTIDGKVMPVKGAGIWALI
ncbi:MAG: hypothetical protein QM683_08480 [Lacrimispora sp.]